MDSSVAQTYPTSDSTIQNIKMSGGYNSVVGYDYDWTNAIDTSGAYVAAFLNTLAQCSGVASIDIEAHSEGVAVALSALTDVSASTRQKMPRVIAVAGPIMGTPMANTADLAGYLASQPGAVVAFGLASRGLAYVLSQPFVADLVVSVPGDNSKLDIIRRTVSPYSVGNAPQIFAVAGDDPGSMQVFADMMALNGVNFSDGFIPLASALAFQNNSSNLPVLKVYPLPPFPGNHIQLIGNSSSVGPSVANAVGAQINTSAASPALSLSSAPICTNNIVCSGTAGTYFSLGGSGLTNNDNYALYQQDDTGNVSSPPLAASFIASNAAVPPNTWQDTPSCGVAPRTLVLFAQDTNPNSPSSMMATNAVTEQVIAGTCIAPNPTPSITLLSPTYLTVGSAAQQLTINGTGFLGAPTPSTVTFKGVSHTATFNSTAQLTIGLTLADLGTAGTFPIVVTNPAPGGGSATTTFTVSPTTNPVPTISQLNPPSLAVGATPQAITITGTGFLTSSTATFNGASHSATYLSGTQLTISLTSTDLASAGTFPVVVTNPAPGGGASSPVNFVVTSSGSTGSTATGNMTTTRSDHTATVLNNGKVLIAGGTTVNGGSCTCSIAELYDPNTGVFTQTGSMTVSREEHTATLLNNGKVLLAGGTGLSSAELYDPATGTFTATGSMTTARYQHIATLLTNGTVLITGGVSGATYLSSAEIYNPVTGTFTATGSMTAARALFSATLLDNGKVLVAGGEINGTAFLSSAELYDPTSGQFTATGALGSGRFYHTATLLNSGKVLIAGGYNVAYLSNSQLYDPTSGTFSNTGSLNIGRSGHTAALLDNGQVLIAGGYSSSYGYLGRPELYDPVSGSFSSAGSMTAARVYHTETLLTDGAVLITGGWGGSGTLSNLASAEIYEPSTFTPPKLVSIAVTSSPIVRSPQWTTQQFTATGTFSDSTTQVLQSVTWNSSNTSVATISNDATDRGVAVGLAPGTVVITASDGTVSGTGIFSP